MLLPSQLAAALSLPSFACSGALFNLGMLFSASYLDRILSCQKLELSLWYCSVLFFFFFGSKRRYILRL